MSYLNADVPIRVADDKETIHAFWNLKPDSIDAEIDHTAGAG
jgi:hypothetical protein